VAVTEYRQVYTHRHSYDSSSAISVPIILSSDKKVHVDLLAKLDTGSSFCIFKKAYANLLGLDYTSGLTQRISTVTGAFEVIDHAVTMAALGYEWEAFVYFAKDEVFVPNVLGRVGFLDQAHSREPSHACKGFAINKRIATDLS
jgi:hypothetical protein